MAENQLALIGLGVMGEALLSGLLHSGRETANVIVSDRNSQRQQQICDTYGVRGMAAADAVAQARTIVFAVKPQDMGNLLTDLAPKVRSGALVVSIAAGITTDFLQAHLPEGTAVVRAMPNTPALVDEGMTVVCPGAHATPLQVEEATHLLQGCGEVITLSEQHLDAVTAISGSGPAYIFYVVEAMIEAGVLLGLPRDTSTNLVVQTLYGAATMLKETKTHPTVLREQVSSPGGTTMAALRELDDQKVRAAFLRAMESAAARSAELASGRP